MFWGNHTAGKTTFWQYLDSEKIEDFINKPDTESTHILNIYKYFENRPSTTSLPDAMIYDFGGQDYYHGLYQAFFSEDAINVLLWNPATNRNEVKPASGGNLTRHFTCDYWLYQFYYKRKKQEKSENQSEDADESILLVQTHADELKRENYTDDFSKFDIVDMFYVSLEKKGLGSKKVYQSALQHLKTSLLEEIEKKKKKENKKEYYPKFLQYILNSKRAKCVRLQDLLKNHYKREQQADESDEYMLSILEAELKQMHRQGLVLYYYNTETLRDVVWLNPAKTVEKIYQTTLASNIIKKNKGSVPEKDFNKNVVRDSRIKDLLINEKIVFYDKENQKYIIPNYLPLSDKEDSYDIMKFGLKEPAFVLKFKHFIPFGLINQLICLYGARPDKKISWRDQLIFTFDNCYKVWIRLLFSTLTIEVYISHEEEKESTVQLKPEEVKRAIFLNIIDLYWGEEVVYDYDRNLSVPDKNNEREFAGDVKKYLERKETASIYSPEDMYLSIDKKIFVQHIQLERMQFSESSIAGYPLNEKNELDFASPKNISVEKYKIYSNNKRLRGMKKVFVSYSKADIREKDEFISHTVTLQEQGLIEKPWTDEWIGFSKEWDKEIKGKIDECDIMVCLISVDFLNTDYIRKVEVKRALEQDKIFVPIVIKPCDWDNSDIAKYQFTLKGKCITLNENDKYLVRESTDVERANYWVKIIKEMRKKIFDKQV
jgi:internalin A